MRRIHFLPVLLAPLLAACDGGEKAALARFDQLSLQIVRGRGMNLSVRDPATTEGDPGLAPLAVVARIRAQVDREEQEGVTGPALRLPPVQVRWYVLEPFCRAHLEATPVEGDSAVNHFVRPTQSGVCHLVAEGSVDGKVFAVDTAVAGFTPGPPVTFHPAPLMVFSLRVEVPIGELAADGARDAWGNLTGPGGGYTATLTSGPPAIVRQDTLIRSVTEGFGNLRITVGGTTGDVELWSIRVLTTHRWTLQWECYDARLADGSRADSAHFRMDSVRASYGTLTGWGLTAGMRGLLRSRTWVQGQPARDHEIPVVQHVAQRPGMLIWHNGQQAATREVWALRYDGGNLCEAPAGGTPWQRFGPARAVRGDSILPQSALRLFP